MNIVCQTTPHPLKGTTADGVISLFILELISNQTPAVQIAKKLLEKISTLSLSVDSLSTASCNGILEGALACASATESEDSLALLHFVAQKEQFPHFLTLRAATHALVTLHQFSFLPVKKDLPAETRNILEAVSLRLNALLTQKSSSEEEMLSPLQSNRQIKDKLTQQLRRTNPLLAQWARDVPSFAALRSSVLLPQNPLG